MTAANLAEILREQPLALDVFRLLTGRGQEPMAHDICGALGLTAGKWDALRSRARRDPETMGRALAQIGMPQLIREQIWREWTIEDVLVDRYKLGRGRAIAGQSRGRALEDEVQAALERAGVPFEARVTFVAPSGATAKCDFAIPSRERPRIVVEVKGYEATGSKLTDFLGDVLKIKQAKAYHTYVLVVTDGRGWHNRKSDLKHLVDLHHDGTIEMIYTRKRLVQLAEDVRAIWSAS
ncbi:MAG TPA: DpnII family type II restriction endonuclease [Thermoanaerobaculia bacterium]|nr:DpnII family type II restriction endonuclease [Thermoanaerobaculia bacterium]